MLKSAPDHDVERFSDSEAMDERIKDWLETPEGTIAHNPSWGHNLAPFKFDPLSKNNGLDVMIEMAIAYKLPLDVNDIILIGVNVEVIDIDLCKIEILHQLGLTSLKVKLWG